MEENVIHINGGITINVGVCVCKKHHVRGNNYVWTCSYENRIYLASIFSNLNNKSEYAIHKRNLKQALNHGLVLKKFKN